MSIHNLQAVGPSIVLFDEDSDVLGSIGYIRHADVHIAGTVDHYTYNPLETFARLSLARTVLDAVVISGHFGIEAVRDVRSLPENLGPPNGIRYASLPIVLEGDDPFAQRIRSTFSDVELVYQNTADVLWLSSDLAPALDRALRNFRRGLLSELHEIGVGVTLNGPVFSVYRAVALDTRGLRRSKYICTSHDVDVADLRRTYVRLLLLEDREWRAERSVQQFEAMLNCPQTTESDFQDFFDGHPQFLYRETAVEHWAQPQFVDERSGRRIRLDFLMRSAGLPQVPWGWDIVELKSPRAPLLTVQEFHRRLSAHVNAGVTQLKDYKHSLVEVNQDEIIRRFGTQIRDPKLTLVIGRVPNPALWERYAELKERIGGVAVTTYDEVLADRKANLLKWRTVFPETTPSPPHSVL